jgi:4-carboxymuconolactone decarboxylase
MADFGGISFRMAKPRITPVKESDWNDVERELLAPIKEAHGSVPNIYRTFVRHPDLFTPRMMFGRHLMQGSSLPARDREILINRIAWLSNAEYEWCAHNRLGRDAGLGDEDLDCIEVGPDAPGLADFDRTLLQATDELFMDAMLANATWDSLSNRYDTHQMMDLVMTVGGYNMLAMALNSFGVPLQDGDEGFPPPSHRRIATPHVQPGTKTRLTEPRIPPISPANWSEEERELLEPLVKARGSVSNLFGTLANHPTVYRLWSRFAGRLLGRSSLPGREREMLINRMAWLSSAEYEWAAHNSIGRREGLTDDEIGALATGPESDVWSLDDRTLLQAVDELHRHCFIEDETWETLRSRFDDRQLMELVLIVGVYKILAMLLNSLGVQLGEGMVGFQ